MKAPNGVDVLSGRNLIKRLYPMFDRHVATLLHIRRAGDISSQQLGHYMLEAVRAAGGAFQISEVIGISKGSRFAVDLLRAGERETIYCDIVVNAAGPFAARVSEMHGEALPLVNALQQKIAFPDKRGAVSRRLPFSIDLDEQEINWTDEERDELASDPSTASLVGPMPGNIHCRPDGGEQGNWIKLGWAYNSQTSEPTRDPELNPFFPELVVRAASRLQPALKDYIGGLPRERTHYGGYYPMTAENWPLLGAADTPGVFLAVALSGYGTMAACAAGDLTARAISGAKAPPFAALLSLQRYRDARLMADLQKSASRGVL
jgi:glycine/D-amino acid oxidase-like deaminating enzyme